MFKLSPLKIAIIYAIIGCLWIFFSDNLLLLFFTNQETILKAQTFKGWFYIAITALLLYILIIKAQHSHLESKERFEKVFNEANDAIFIMKDDVFVECNIKATEMFGRKKEDFLGYNPEKFSPEYQKDGVTSKEKAIMVTGKTLAGENQSFEWLHCKEDGTQFEVEVSLSRVKLSTGMHVLAISRDITEKKKAEEKILKSLEEKKLLLAEIHHRVKNNLAVVSAMLNLQAASAESDKDREMFFDTVGRINAIAQVHNNLYSSNNFSSIDFGLCCANIINKVIPLNSGFTFEKDIDSVNLGIDYAVPIGMICNELITNAVKHAFKDKKNGTVKILLKENDNDSISLVVSDNGIGLPDSIDMDDPQTIGMILVKTLIIQIHGEINVSRENGTCIEIIFGNKEPRNRLKDVEPI